MNRKWRLNTWLVWVLAFSLMAAPASAISGSQDVDLSCFEGTLLLEDGGLERENLEGVEIQVYSAFEPIEIGDGATVYSKEYLFSVYTDSLGRFSLQKPTGDFELMLRSDTLPEGFSVDCHAKRYSESAVSGYFSLRDEVTVLSTDRKADQVEAMNQFTERLESDGVYRTTNLSLSGDGITLLGVVENQGGVIPVSRVFSFEDNDPLSVVDELFNAELISKSQQVEQYCNILDMHLIEDEICLNPIISELQYFLDNSQDRSLSQEIQSEELVFLERVRSTVAELRAAPPGMGDDPVKRDHFCVYYHESIDESAAIDVAEYLDLLYDAATADGFREPLLEANKDRIEVFLTPNPGEGNLSNANAATWSSTAYGSRRAGYIHVYNFAELDSGTKETIAHEYFHLVQYAYKKAVNDYENCKWLYESSAVWFSIRYSGYADRALGHLNKYLTTYDTEENIWKSNCNQNLFSNEASKCYQAGPYFMTIDMSYGGIDVIEDVWAECGSIGTVLNTNDAQELITEAIAEHDLQGSCVEAYKKMALHLTYPEYFYSSILPENFEWTNWTTSQPLGTISDMLLYDFGCYQFKYEDRSNVSKTLTVTLDFEFGTSNSYCVARNSGGYYLYNNPVTSNSATITIPQFGTTTKEVFVVPINTSTATVGSVTLLNVYATAS